MLSKCANPACTKPFHYLRDGRLYEVEIGPHSELHIRAASGHPLPDVEIVASPGSSSERRGPQLIVNGSEGRRLEYFWLCEGCSNQMTLAHGRDGLEIIPLPRRRAAAS